jgi:type IV pilus assembly protein PilN
MSTIAINLLPHRALKRAQRRRDFFVLAGLTAGAAFLLVVLIGGVIQGYVVAQQSKNAYIKTKNGELDKQIAEVATLRQEIEALRARQTAVEDLQSDRNQPVHLLDELVKQTPEGIYLRSIKQDGQKVALTGFAQSNERVSELLRNLANNSSWLEKPNLIEIKVSTQTQMRGPRLFEFSMDVLLKRQQPPKDAPPAAAGSAAAPAASPAPAAPAPAASATPAPATPATKPAAPPAPATK